MPIPAGATVTFDDVPAGKRLPLPPGATVEFADQGGGMDAETLADWKSFQQRQQTHTPESVAARNNRNRTESGAPGAGNFSALALAKKRADYEALPVRGDPGSIPNVVMQKGLQGVTAGFSDEALGAIDTALGAKNQAGKKLTYSENRDARRKTLGLMGEARPLLSAGSEFGGSLVSGAAIPVSRAASIPRAMGESFALGAGAGLGYSNADLTKGEYGKAGADMLKAGTTSSILTGIVAKGVRGAPERVTGRLATDSAIGETTAKQSLRTKVEMAAGEGNVNLDRVTRETGLRRMLATTAQDNPGKAVKIVAKTTRKINASELDPAYKKMDAVDDINRTQVVADLGKVARSLDDAGHFDAGSVVKRKMEQVIRGGAEPGAKGTLSTTALRNMKKELGPSAFKTPDFQTLPGGEAAQRQIYGVLDDTIKAKALRTPGVNPEAVAKANDQISTLIPVSDALAERASKARSDSVSWTTRATQAGGVTTAMALAAGGNLTEAIGVLAIPLAKKIAARGYRIGDYELSRLIEAARNGSRGAQLSQAAIEMGVARAAAPAVSRLVSDALDEKKD